MFVCFFKVFPELAEHRVQFPAVLSDEFEAITSVRLSVLVDGPLGTPSFPIGQVDVGVASEKGG